MLGGSGLEDGKWELFPARGFCPAQALSPPCDFEIDEMCQLRCPWHFPRLIYMENGFGSMFVSGTWRRQLNLHRPGVTLIHMIPCSSVPHVWEFGGQKLALPDVSENIALCLWCTLSGLPSLSSRKVHTVWLTHAMPVSSLMV